MTRASRLWTRVVFLGSCLGTPALAEEALTQPESTKPADAEASNGSDPSMSLDPAVPNVGALPGGMSPAYGQPATGAGDWRFDFHGFLSIPLRAGINDRQNRLPGESQKVWHAPPVVPDDAPTFSHTGVVPNPYVQLNFSYGNDVVTGNVSLLARQATVSTGFFDPPSQAGVNDVYLHIRPRLGKRADLQIYVGSFSNRYGVAGEYDEGRYGTPLIARINGAGETMVATLTLNRQFTLLLEQGIQGQTNKAPSDITPDGWNDFADPNAGTTFAHHWHAGVSYLKRVTLGGHFISAFTHDDWATGTLAADGNVQVLGGDLRLNLGRFGHLYGAVAHTRAQDAATISQVVEILNTRGGRGLMDNYLGSNSAGNGKLVAVGAQYDLSVGKLVSYPVPFTADGPDLTVSLFGMNVKVLESEDATREGQSMLKYGSEVTYSMLSWLATSLRFDRVQPDVQVSNQSFAILSPCLIFHTDWSSSDQVALQYSHWFNGSDVRVRTGYPPVEDPTAVADQDMIALTASMWW